MFPICLYLATRRLTSPLAISQRAATAEKDYSVTTIFYHSFFVLPCLTCLLINSKLVTETCRRSERILASPLALLTRGFALEYRKQATRAQMSAQAIDMYQR